MADAAVGFVLENLKQLLLYNADLIGNDNDQIEGLHKDFIVLKAFLRDSMEMRRKNNILQELVENIRTVAYTAEDVIDKYVVEMSKFKAQNKFKKAVRSFDHSTIRSIAKEIKTISKEVQQIYDRKLFGLEDLQLEEVPDRGATDEKQQPPVVEEENVVGFDEEAKMVFEFLNGKEKNLDILTIVGMPGLGKTTLARKVYNDRETEYNFLSRAWVYVSATYTRREVFLSLLNDLAPGSNPPDMEESHMLKKLHRYLYEGKYLIVLDDVWTKEAWLELKFAFPQSYKGSRILITSRNKDVALHANPNRPPHMLNILTEEHSWELLEIKVYGKQKCPVELQGPGKQIAKICGGLPLAIVVIAGILLNNRDSTDHWNQVANDVKSFIIKDAEQFMNLIRWSFNHLPYYLKSCFLYLGVFPENYEIPVWKLILLWIAEGFIEQNGKLILEDVAKACMEDLVNMNLLMPMGRHSDGQIKTCRVQNVVRDYCVTEALEQNLYQEIKRSDQITTSKYRRVCIHSILTGYLPGIPIGEHIRSFLCLGQNDIPWPREYLSYILKGFELLKVLDISGFNLSIFPKELLLLAFLRYIALSCNIKVLPAISRLWNLQTLVFFTAHRTIRFPEDIWQSHHLRHLKTNASALLPSPSNTKVSNENNVQTLAFISPESCTHQVFSRTPHIKKLGVRGNLSTLFEDGFRLFDNIGQLNDLTNLKLVHDVSYNLLSGRKALEFPYAYLFPPNLKKLTLSGTAFNWEYMYVLGKLEMLEILKLRDDAFRGKLWDTKDGGFISLKYLHIGRTDMETWKASRRHFPSLKHLVLQHCEKLEAIPLGLADIPSFQVLELHRPSQAAASSARKIQQKKLQKEGRYTSSGSGGFKLSCYPPEF